MKRRWRFRRSLLSPHKRRGHLGPNAYQSPGRFINHRPSRICPHNDLARGINKIHPPVKLRTLWFAFNPSIGGNAFACSNIPAVVNFVPGHDPEIGRDMFRRGNRLPVRCRHVLNPPHPDGVVNVAELVNVIWLRGKCARKWGHFSDDAIPICQMMNAASSAFSRNRSNRPDLPPWPAPMLVLSSNTLSSVFISRSLATIFAGSQ